MSLSYLFQAFFCFFFQAEDGIRDAQESRGLGDVYKRQPPVIPSFNQRLQFVGLAVDIMCDLLDVGGSGSSYACVS